MYAIDIGYHWWYLLYQNLTKRTSNLTFVDVFGFPNNVLLKPNPKHSAGGGGGMDTRLDDINTTHVYSGSRCYDNKDQVANFFRYIWFS